MIHSLALIALNPLLRCSFPEIIDVARMVFVQQVDATPDQDEDQKLFDVLLIIAFIFAPALVMSIFFLGRGTESNESSSSNSNSSSSSSSSSDAEYREHHRREVKAETVAQDDDHSSSGSASDMQETQSPETIVRASPPGGGVAQEEKYDPDEYARDREVGLSADFMDLSSTVSAGASGAFGALASFGFSNREVGSDAPTSSTELGGTTL